MRDYARQQLTDFRNTLREDSDECLQDLYPPEEFVPDTVIENVLDNLYSISGIPSLKPVIDGHALLEPYLLRLLDIVEVIRNEFEVMRLEAKATKAAKAKATRDRKKAERAREVEGLCHGTSGTSSDAGSGSDSGTDTSDCETEVQGDERQEAATVRLFIRIPARSRPV
ncbi:hypothetical protein NUW54_g11618 [Trametes sanguinea]|uniref:Uncharacterized protein n=1 Tax=Trametes sanguinea TaxID=158606 RepID=A0ACC1NCH4_9APHY|nr:hypothetical protein NUW54_g11618 [Trametes sanguinea]